MPALALSALALALGFWGERRLRRLRLNEGLHELRRPLQALALAVDGEGGELDRFAAVGCLDAATAAVSELDRTINGARGERRERLESRSLLGEAARRWAPSGRVQVSDQANLGLRGDRHRIAAALDNLIANALEHGAGPVRVLALEARGRLRLEVDNAPADKASARRPARPAATDRGHGLRIAARTAVEHGGTLQRPRLERGRIRAGLELPGEAVSERAA